MNQIDEKELIHKATRKYVKHKWLSVYVKANASTPYEKSFFHKLIADSKNPKLRHTHYMLYIHEDYLTISSLTHTYEPVKVMLHDKLWIELYTVFNLEGETDDVNLMNDSDAEPI